MDRMAYVERDGQHYYAVALAAQRAGEVKWNADRSASQQVEFETAVFCCFAHSLAEARGLALEYADTKWPAAKSWRMLTSIVEVSDALLADSLRREAVPHD